MKVLVTGGAGYVGYSLIQALIDRYGTDLDELVVFDNLSRHNHALFTARRFTDVNIRFVAGEILDGRTLDRAVADVDVVYHLAGLAHTPNSDGDAHGFDQVNNWGTAQVVAAIEKSDRVRDVVYLSSSAVYGSDAERRSAATARPQPASVYGISKLRGEGHIERLAETHRTLIIRSGNVYGFNNAMRVEAVVNVMAFHARFNGRVTIVGSGHQHRAFVEVDRLARRLAALPASDLPSGTYDAVEHNLSILDIADGLRKLHPDVESIFIDQDMRMRNVLVEPSPDFVMLDPTPIPSFDDDLRDLNDALGF